MTEYIVDTSVVIQRLIRDTYSSNAIALFRRLALLNPDELCVPEFCLIECTNVIWKEVRFRGMPQTVAENLADDLANLPLTVVLASDHLKRALQIGLAHQIVIYDSIYIALAEKLAYPLITVDREQAKAATALGITLKPITDFTP